MPDEAVHEEHFFGWISSKPDFRDYLFAAVPAVLAALPPLVDLSVPEVPAPFSPAWSQGRLGSCGPHTVGADIVFAALRQQNLPNVSMPSRLFIYYITRMLQGTINSDSGVSNRELLKALARHGWCDEALWPYVIGNFTVRPPDSCWQQASKRKLTQYLSVPQNLEQMLGCLAGGDPFIFGFSVYESINNPEVGATGDVPMPKRTERQIGGHDVLVCAYNLETRRFKFKNSWGSAWGLGGFGTIPFEYATNPQLAGDFWTVKHAALPAPEPTPVPPVPPDPPAPPVPVGKRIITVTGGTIEVDGRPV